MLCLGRYPGPDIGHWACPWRLSVRCERPRHKLEVTMQRHQALEWEAQGCFSITSLLHFPMFSLSIPPH